MIEQLLEPIDAKTPAGVCEEGDEGHKALEELEDIMLKYGSLHQSGIDWEQVETLSTGLLRKHCKHYRVVLHLITYWLNKRGVPGLRDSLELLRGFLAQYWEDGHPRPGAKNVRYRKKLAEQILFRIDQAAERLQNDAIPGELIDAINTAWPALKEQIDARGLDAKLKKLADFLAELKPKEGEKDKPARVVQTAEEPAKKATKLADLGDERQIKRTLFDLADLINRQKVADPLGYELRRYALWSGIHAAPPQSRNGESELMSPPMDVMREYVDLINSGSVNLEVIQRIEKSVTASPFWLMGSLYTAGALRKLEHRDTALAILRTVDALLRRVPDLAEGRFRGGAPYVDTGLLERLMDDCEAHDGGGYADDHDAAEAQQSPFDLEWADLQEEWTTLREEQGILPILEQLEKHQKKADTPRQAFYLKLLAGEQMRAAGLKQVAQDMLAHALKQVADMPVNEWEPDYLQRAKSILESR